MDRDQAVALRKLLMDTSAAPEWLAASSEFGLAVQAAPRSAGGLLVAGPADAEPWHFTAHLTDEAQWAQLPFLTPTLLRAVPDAGAPAHLSVGWERLAQSGRGEALLVVAEVDPQDELLERIDEAKHNGTRVLALAQAAPELRGLAHETLVVPPARAEGLGPLSFDTAQHLVSLATTAQPGRRGGLRSRLVRWQERSNGPAVQAW